MRIKIIHGMSVVKKTRISKTKSFQINIIQNVTNKYQIDKK